MSQPERPRRPRRAPRPRSAWPVRLARSLPVRVVLVAAVSLAAFAYSNNGSWRAHGKGEPLILAHRGMAQTFGFEGITNETCTAGRIHPPEHPYLENTLPSMRAAFKAGADMVEFDVQVTRDRRIAVFHDATLECRTDGRGEVRDHTLAELRRLDVGYGYTADGGATHPFRGKGVGRMPALEQVLAAFPEQKLLIHVKSDVAADGELLAARLATLPPKRLAALTVYGGDRPVAALAARLPAVQVMSKALMLDCLKGYLAVGWTGYVPGSCAGLELHVPEKYGRWLWGWPNLFVERMRAHGTRVIVVAGSGDFSEGFDAPADLSRLPEDYTGGVWTNRVDVVAPLLRR
ncbi:glycerophosphodiester phosphodiesterase family protein [Streptosporangium sp. NPDC004379]|uniref:glycerophosphodiester phosphodiesterase family protein n=1 Tax=Streptosporangium sp. NPDC004379 TaxID=3366189 RepID=UPI00367882E7